MGLWKFIRKEGSVLSVMLVLMLDLERDLDIYRLTLGVVIEHSIACFRSSLDWTGMLLFLIYFVTLMAQSSGNFV